MGRFDALTQIEEKQEKITPPSAAHSPTPVVTQTQPVKKPNGSVKKPAKPQARKTASQFPTLDSSESPEKYTTRLEPSLIKKIRIHAAEKDLKDYQVVKIALNQFFEKNK